MKRNSQTEKKREIEIEDLVANPIVTEDFEAIFEREKHGGQVVFKLLNKHVIKPWGSLIKDEVVLFRIMEDVNILIEEEYLQFRKHVEELIVY